jgi:hypothetical protein
VRSSVPDGVQQDLLVGFVFDQKIDDLLRDIDVEHGKYEMLEISQFVPTNIAIIESIRSCLSRDGKQNLSNSR